MALPQVLNIYLDSDFINPQRDFLTNPQNTLTFDRGVVTGHKYVAQSSAKTVVDTVTALPRAFVPSVSFTSNTQVVTGGGKPAQTTTTTQGRRPHHPRQDSESRANAVPPRTAMGNIADKGMARLLLHSVSKNMSNAMRHLQIFVPVIAVLINSSNAIASCSTDTPGCYGKVTFTNINENTYICIRIFPPSKKHFDLPPITQSNVSEACVTPLTRMCIKTGIQTASIDCSTTIKDTDCDKAKLTIIGGVDNSFQHKCKIAKPWVR